MKLNPINVMLSPSNVGKFRFANASVNFINFVLYSQLLSLINSISVTSFL